MKYSMKGFNGRLAEQEERIGQPEEQCNSSNQKQKERGAWVA